MSAPRDLAGRVQVYLAERRSLGFGMRCPSQALPSFARFVEASKHSGPLSDGVDRAAHLGSPATE